MHLIATHAVGRAVFLFIREGGEPTIGDKQANQWTMDTATAAASLYLGIDSVYGITGHSKDVMEFVNSKDGGGRAGRG